jgi:hypothetical protein
MSKGERERDRERETERARRGGGKGEYRQQSVWRDRQGSVGGKRRRECREICREMATVTQVEFF